MKRILAAGLLLACASLCGCVAAIVGGGGSSSNPDCQQRDPRTCEHK